MPLHIDAPVTRKVAVRLFRFTELGTMRGLFREVGQNSIQNEGENLRQSDKDILRLGRSVDNKATDHANGRFTDLFRFAPI